MSFSSYYLYQLPRTQRGQCIVYMLLLLLLLLLVPGDWGTAVRKGFNTKIRYSSYHDNLLNKQLGSDPLASIDFLAL